jgi:hypothetical protein
MLSLELNLKLNLERALNWGLNQMLNRALNWLPNRSALELWRILVLIAVSPAL